VLKISGRYAGVTAFGKTTGRQRVILNDITEDRQPWTDLVTASVAESAGR